MGRGAGLAGGAARRRLRGGGRRRGGRLRVPHAGQRGERQAYGEGGARAAEAHDLGVGFAGDAGLAGAGAGLGAGLSWAATAVFRVRAHARSSLSGQSAAT